MANEEFIVKLSKAIGFVDEFYTNEWDDYDEEGKNGIKDDTRKYILPVIIDELKNYKKKYPEYSAAHGYLSDLISHFVEMEAK
jgi:hypothetical protein